MNENEFSEHELANEIKDLRKRCGCLKEIHDAKKLTTLMGCADTSDQYKASCLITVINEFFKEGEQADLLLLGLNLLKGYENSKSAKERRLKYYQDYLCYENLAEKNIDNTLQKRENKFIEQLAKQLIESTQKKTLTKIIEAAPKELKLPAPRYRKDISKKDSESKSQHNIYEEILKTFKKEITDCNIDKFIESKLPYIAPELLGWVDIFIKNINADIINLYKDISPETPEKILYIQISQFINALDEYNKFLKKNTDEWRFHGRKYLALKGSTELINPLNISGIGLFFPEKKIIPDIEQPTSEIDKLQKYHYEQVYSFYKKAFIQ